MMKTADKRRQGFTLLELITVVMIIMILAGVLLPAIQKTRRKAKETQAATEATAIANALRTYYHEYGQWPCPDPAVGGCWTNDNNVVMSMLTPPNNPRNIEFWQSGTVAVDPLGANYAITISVTGNWTSVRSTSTGIEVKNQ